VIEKKLPKNLYQRISSQSISSLYLKSLILEQYFYFPILSRNLSEGSKFLVCSFVPDGRPGRQISLFSTKKFSQQNLSEKKLKKTFISPFLRSQP
jgi:hypothetical protein